VIDAYLEGGMVLVVAILFAGQIMFLQKTLMGKLEEIEQITIKLIDRFGRTDDVNMRHYENTIKEIDDISDSINYLKGKINGGGSR
jgi:hypothetical protein